MDEKRIPTPTIGEVLRNRLTLAADTMNNDDYCYYQTRISQKEFDKMDDQQKRNDLIGVYFAGHFYPAAVFYDKNVTPADIEVAQMFLVNSNLSSDIDYNITLEDIAKDKRRAFYVVKRKAKLPNYDE